MTRICYITPNAPLPVDRGGRIRSHHLWRALSAFAETQMIVLGDRPPRAERDMLLAGGAVLMPRRLLASTRTVSKEPFKEVIDPPGLWELGGNLSSWAGSERFWHGLTRADAFHRHHLNERRIARLLRRVKSFDPDVVVIDDTSLAPLIPPLKASGLKVVISPENLDSRLWADISARSDDPAYRRWAEIVSRNFLLLERTYLPMADQVWVCSEVDGLRFREQFGLADVRVAPNVVDVDRPPLQASGRDLVYVAQMGYRPNEEAALYLIEMSRKFAARGIEHRLHLVGRAPENVRRAATGQPQISVHGIVPNTASFLAMAAVVPVPLQSGGGTRIKIIEAMASARPVVSTSIGIEGINACDGHHALIADNMDAFDDAVLRVLEDRYEAERLGSNGYQLAEEQYSPRALASLIAEHLQALGVAPRADASSSSMPRAWVVSRSGRFNSLTRLLQLRMAVRADRPLTDVDIELANNVDPKLYNSSISVSRSTGAGRPVQWLDITAVLPSSHTVDDVVVIAGGYGREVLRTTGAGAEMTQETCGLVSADVDQDGTLAGSLWSRREYPPPSITLERTVCGEVSRRRDVPGRSDVDVARFSISQAVRPGKIWRADLEPNPARQDAVGQTFWIHDSFTREKSLSSRRLLEMKDRHKGQIAWIIGNGPSVRIEDLDRLHNKLTFAFNRFHLAHERTVLRPTYTVSADKQMIEDFGQAIVDESGGSIFLANDQCPKVVGDFIWVRQLGVFPPLFSRDPSKWVSPGGSSLYVAMQIAHFMGIRHFYIYGADFKFVYENHKHADKFRVAVGDSNHFIPNYRDNKAWCPPSFPNICPAFLNARLMMESDNGWIRNATRGGLLEMFDREDFEIALVSG